MATLKKVLSLGLALLTASSLLTAASCGGDKHTHDWKESEILSQATCITEGEVKYVCDCGETKTEKALSDEHEWGDYVRVSAPTCTEAGVKTRACLLDSTHTESADIDAQGHDYGNQGQCVNCNAKVVPPQADANATYVNLDANNSEISGTGMEFDWFRLSVDSYYELTVGRATASNPSSVWVNFHVPSPGQYAIYSIENDGLGIMRFDASAQYIPVDSEGNYIGFEAGELENGNFISTVNCPSLYWSREWFATFRLQGTVSGSSVKFRVVKIGEEAWIPGYETVDITAKEINGKKAPEGAENATAVVVPYDANYYFDAEAGYYRMGTSENPGELIYAAITAPASRLLGDKSFNAIQGEGNNLGLDGGVNADGDYVILNYVPMLLNHDGLGNEVDTGKNCYQNYVNADGMYPVTQELYEFLNNYAKKNGNTDDTAWLAACYYYAEIAVGTESNPILLTDVGTVNVQTQKRAYTYYLLKYKNANNSAAASRCKISCTAENAVLIFENETLYGPFEIVVETNDTTGILLQIGDKDGKESSFALTIENAGTGYTSDEAIAVSAGTVALEPLKIYQGDSVIYEAYYVYTVEADGVLSVACEADVLLLVNGEPLNEENVYEMEVVAGQQVSIYVSTQSSDAVSVEISE